MAHDAAARKRAEKLYIVDRLTLEEVAGATGIALRTVQKWSSEDGWKAKRDEYREAEREIEHYTRLARLKLIKDVCESLDPQKIYAFAALERAVKGGAGAMNSATIPSGKVREIHTPQDAVEALEEAIQNKLNVMLTRPEAINLSAIKDMKKAMELVEDLKAKHRPSEGKSMTKEELTEFMKERIYGLL